MQTQGQAVQERFAVALAAFVGQLHQLLLLFACTSASMSCPLLCSLEGAEWIANKGLWRMPMYHYAALMKALPKVPGVRLDVEPLPPVAQALVQVSQTYWLI